MIKTNELRLGNWLTGSVRPNECMQIKSIDTNICKLGEYLEDYKSVEPIPITPKILEKCGFTTDENKVEYNIGLPLGTGTDLSIEDEGDPSLSCCLKSHHHIDESKYDFVYIKDIRYVHQLQNLYWCLCGEELNITM